MKLTITIDLDKVPTHKAEDMPQEVGALLAQLGANIAGLTNHEFTMLYSGLATPPVYAHQSAAVVGKAKLK